MKHINYILPVVFLLSSCISKPNVKNPDQIYPPYKLINLFSQKIQPDTDLTLRSYGINCFLPKGYEYKNGIGNFTASYSLSRKKNDTISLEFARNLIVFLSENLLAQINSSNEIKPNLDIYPFTDNLIHISIYFEDDSRIELGQGISNVMLSKGKIIYEGYNIREYRDQYPAIGKHYVIHEESYADALEIVRKQGSLKYLN